MSGYENDSLFFHISSVSASQELRVHVLIGTEINFACCYSNNNNNNEFLNCACYWCLNSDISLTTRKSKNSLALRREYDQEMPHLHTAGKRTAL